MSEATDKITLFRKFGLHASADALAYREGKTCRTCVHLDSDPRDEPCGTCRRFERWQDARAEQSKAARGVAPTAQPGELHAILEFLYGAAPLDGCWFGDGCQPTGQGRYWWRSRLRAALAAAGVPACQPTEAQYQRRQGIRNLDGELEWRSWQVCTQKEAARIDGLSSWQWRKVTIPAAGVAAVDERCNVARRLAGLSVPEHCTKCRMSACKGADGVPGTQDDQGEKA